MHRLLGQKLGNFANFFALISGQSLRWQKRFKASKKNERADYLGRLCGVCTEKFQKNNKLQQIKSMYGQRNHQHLVGAGLL